MECGDTSLYRELNKALRSENRKALKIWFPYLKLFDTASDKLPTVKQVVWRDVPLDIGKSLSKNQTVTWCSISSCSSSVSVIESFLEKEKSSTLFLIEAINGKNVAGYTAYENEDEIILRIGTEFHVKYNTLNHPNGSHVVHLVEIDEKNDQTSNEDTSILASIDRALITSSNARTRQRSTLRMAYTCVVCGTIFWALFHSHELFLTNIIQTLPNFFLCYFDQGVYRTFLSYYLLIKELLVLVLLTVCGLWSIKNIQRSARRIGGTTGAPPNSGYDIDPSRFNLILCRSRLDAIVLFNCLSAFYLILASIDQILVTSRNARTRQRSTQRLVYTCIIGGTLFWSLFHIHALICSTPQQISPNTYLCYYQPGFHVAFVCSYALIKEPSSLLLMVICGLWAKKNIRSTTRRVGVAVDVSVTKTDGASTENSAASKDRQMVLMLL
ncbi:unnamed protein product, partial [Rotaria sp. Silwood1]